MIRRWLPIVSLLASTVAVVVALVVYVKLADQDERINGNRVVQTRQSCRERNVERAALRGTFSTQRQQTRRVPAEAFAQFGVTKREALARLNDAISEFHRLDCKARVAAVRDTLD